MHRHTHTHISTQTGRYHAQISAWEHTYSTERDREREGERECVCVCVHRFDQNLRLGRLKAAWDCAVAVRSADVWGRLAVTALEMLDIDMAIAGETEHVCPLEAICDFQTLPVLLVPCKRDSRPSLFGQGTESLATLTCTCSWPTELPTQIVGLASIYAGLLECRVQQY